MTKAKKPLLDKVNEAAALFGSIGGKATARKLGKEGMSERGRAGAKKRWTGHVKK